VFHLFNSVPANYTRLDITDEEGRRHVVVVAGFDPFASDGAEFLAQQATRNGWSVELHRQDHFAAMPSAHTATMEFDIDDLPF